MTHRAFAASRRSRRSAGSALSPAAPRCSIFSEPGRYGAGCIPANSASPQRKAVGVERLSASGLDRKDLALEPIDPEPGASVIRQRRYARLKLSRNIIASTTNLRENFRLSIPELNLSGGIGSGERHLAPGSLLNLKLTHGVRHIKAQAIVRGARPQAMAFEFVDMDLEERGRLRRLLLELGGLPIAAQVTNRAKRRGRIALSK